MITEDQLEQLAIQWHGQGRNIEHRTSNIERRSGEKTRLAESVRVPGSRQISRQSVAREAVGYRDSPKMLKPPWWAASLLLQHMVDELTKGRTSSGSDKVEFRTHGSYRLRKSATGVTKPGPRMCRPFRAWNSMDDGTQGAALGCHVMPRWGGRNGQMQTSGARRRMRS